MANRDRDVFINAPFDVAYKPIFDAIVFAVIRYGFRVRCALEADDAGDSRFAKLCDIVRECPYGIHDISRTQVNGKPRLPRFNMPLELGLFLGARHFGGRDQRRKVCLILDREKYRYQKFISDISGQDIHAHADDPKKAIAEVTTWLRGLPVGLMPGGGTTVRREYRVFQDELVGVCREKRIRRSELSFKDLNELMTLYIVDL